MHADWMEDWHIQLAMLPGDPFTRSATTSPMLPACTPSTKVPPAPARDRTRGGCWLHVQTLTRLTTC
jgi:hypothetical protein